MTPDELRAIGRQLYGDRWQTTLSRAVGISDRHMRRMVAGTAPIAPGLAREIRSLSEWPRDEWIVSVVPGGREYVAHLLRPRFVARVVAVDADGLPRPEEEPADVLTGITHSGRDYVLCEIVWTDNPPTGDALLDLFAEANLALDRRDEE